ncbi:MAG: glucose 1-dehydrogenase [Anaerolineae bacterium]|nr:glucose 1-dehydrogenase [Anaerolineae bacterium]MDW8100551.1 glucose 1-dehydrogenase [Anaerolineae bacterium]
MKLAGKVAIITGAGAGIGRATALLFAREGARVIVADHNPNSGAETVTLIRQAGGEAVFVQADVAVATDAEKMISTALETFGRLDILVNNAGIYAKGDTANTTEEEWDRILDVNLKGVFLCSKYAIPAMKKTGGGVIVNVASEAGLVAIKNQVAYNVSKAGVIALTKSIAVDFAADNIRANCICPGTTETPLVQAALAKEADPTRTRRVLEESRPLNRLGRPEEIAAGILYLASDELGYATGAVLSVDGGYTVQ